MLLLPTRTFILLGLLGGIAVWLGNRAHTQALPVPIEVNVKHQANADNAHNGVNTRQQMQLPSERYGMLQPEQLPVSLRLPPLEPASQARFAANEIGATRRLELSAQALTDSPVRTNEDGSQLRFLVLQAPGAVELRVHFSQFNLPKNETVHVYGLRANSYVAGPYQRQGPAQRKDAQLIGDFWTDTIQGDTVIIEHFSTGTLRGSFAIPELMHHVASALTVPEQTQPLPCHVDANCLNDQLNNAVGRLTYIKNGSAFTCSGTMVAAGLALGNTTDTAPYLLTANHCVATAAVAATVQIAWLQRSTACNSGIATTTPFITPTGTNLLKTSRSANQTLLRVLKRVPAAQAYAPWRADAPPQSTGVFGLHHPRGSFLRRAEGSLTNTQAACPATGLTDGYGVTWDSGLTEPGSSGSAIFTKTDRKIVGVLSCDDVALSCSNKGVNSYGKFANFYPLIATYLQFGDRGPTPTALVPPLTANTPVNMTDSLTTAVPARVLGEAAEGKPYYGKVFLLNGLAGQKLRLTLSANAFDAYLAVLTPNKLELLSEDDDSGDGTNAALTVTLPETGAYLIEATTALPGETGAFSLQATLECTYTLDRTLSQFSAAGGTSEISLQNTNCPWTASSNAPWLKLSQSSGTGSGRLTLTAEANNTSQPRSAIATIAGQTVQIEQAGTCVARALTPGQSATGALATGDCRSPNAPGLDAPLADLYSFNATSGLAIRAVASSNAFIPVVRLMRATGQILEANLNTTNSNAVTIPATGTNFHYTIPASGAYLLEITAGKLTSATPPGNGAYQIELITNCSVALTKAFTVSKSGGPLTINLSAPAACGWRATNYADWIRINSGTTGAGPGAVNLLIAPNNSIRRTAQMVIAGELVTLTQENGCAYALSPANRTFSAGGGSGEITVSTAAGCPWSAQSNVNWLLTSNSPDQTGSGTASYAVLANSANVARVGVIGIGGQNHGVMQNALAPNPMPTLSGLSSTSIIAGAPGFTLSITGSNFIQGSVVRWNGNNRTTRQTGGALQIELTANELANSGTARVTVFNPAPGGGESNALNFTINGGFANLSAAAFNGEFSPEAIVAGFGTGLAIETLAARTTPLPTTLAGTTVKLRDGTGRERLAPLFFVSPRQINYLIPADTPTGHYGLIVTSGDGKVSLGELTVQAIAPGLFAANANGKDAPSAFLVRVNASGVQTVETLLTYDTILRRWLAKPIDVSNPRETVVLVLYGTGIRGRSSLREVFAQLGRDKLTVAYAGPQGNLTGLDQINLVLPPRLAGLGATPLALIVDEQPSNAVTLEIR